jgi:hypothetical protein
MLATLFALAAGALHLYMRFDHNSQGEMFSTGRIDLFYSGELFLLAFVSVWLITLIGCLMAGLVSIFWEGFWEDNRASCEVAPGLGVLIVYRPGKQEARALRRGPT